MNSRIFEVKLAAPAQQDFLEIMEWTVDQFGAVAADRYETLIGQALIDIGEDPFRAGTRQRPELNEGIHTFHLASSRQHVAGERVKTPRHFLLYRVDVAHVEVLRILHDSRDLEQHLPQA